MSTEPRLTVASELGEDANMGGSQMPLFQGYRFAQLELSVGGKLALPTVSEKQLAEDLRLGVDGELVFRIAGHEFSADVTILNVEHQLGTTDGKPNTMKVKLKMDVPLDE